MNERKLSFDRSTASVDAIQRAVYRLSDRLSCDITPVDSAIEVTVHPASPDDDGGQLLGELRNEVLDQSLRERIREETSDVRNLVLSLAFSKTGLADGDV
jgi:His-Xaa-Ser system protein HxsD